MSNTLSQSNAIYDTYTPVQPAAVRKADLARELGRRELPEENKSGNFPTQAPVSESELRSKPTSAKKVKG
jgi:hypothetical protein